MGVVLATMLKPYLIEFLQHKHSNAIILTVVVLMLGRKLLKKSVRKSLADANYDLEAKMYPQYFKNKQGLQLHWRQWNPLNSSPKAVIFLSHGFAEHCGRYDGFARRLTERGFMVLALDHQGHGRSQGDRAYVESWAHYHEDYIAFMRHVYRFTKQFKCKHFLFGHSMGGLIAAGLAHRLQSMGAIEMADEQKTVVRDEGLPVVIGVILSAPLMKGPHVPGAASLQPLLVFLSKFVPKIELSFIKIATHKVSRNQDCVAHYNDDRLNYSGSPVLGWCVEMDKEVKRMISVYSECSFRFLALAAGDDALVDSKQVQAFHDESTSSDKTIKWYDAAYHELLMDNDFQQVGQDILQWLEARLK